MVKQLLVLLLLALPALGKSLHWNAIDVQARLDAEGRLHVIERQRIVFDGDWNGGERNFALREHQTLQLHRILRVDNGREIALQHGGLGDVDRYDFAGPGVVRWRSRLETDPPFANEEITYVLDYTYANILEHEGGNTFELSHDFGLPERAGAVERFTLLLELHPVWQTPAIRETRQNLPPGSGVVVERDLEFAGASWPAGVRKPPARWPAPLLFLAFAVAVWMLLRAFLRGERAKGRFDPVPPQFAPELLALKAEIAGAVWDAGVGPPEVAATLARMTQEGKITTRVDGETMYLHLNVPRSELEGYETGLVLSLFVAGGDDTDTNLIREHYKTSGFDPVRVISPGIEAELNALIGGWGTKSYVNWPVLLLTLFGALILLGLAALFDDDVAAGSLPLGLVVGGVAAFIARVQQRKIGTPAQVLVAPMILLGILSLAFAVACLQASRDPVPLWALVPIALWLLAWIRLALELLKMPDPAPVLAYRKRIAAARAFFAQELQKPEPNLRDEWFPYLLAFGLGPQVDQWFQGFGAARGSSSSSSWSSSSSTSSAYSGSSSSASSWTGGGGAFGGAGATGSWAVAAGAMAAGVASPSSSGSGGSGGGGGGGSSSGGGGGGGW